MRIQRCSSLQLHTIKETHHSFTQSCGALLFALFNHEVCTVLEAVEKDFMFVGRAELAAQVPNGIVVIQW